MSTPLVSCIVPVFNGERYLAEALDSVLGQTYRALEVIVVDDGSTDGTPAVVRTFGARVRCVTQPNAGLAAARNRGLAAATAELVAFLDADDLWLPEKIACQMERFRARPELEVSLTHIQNFWADDRPVAAEERGTHSMEPMPGYSSPAMLARR
jgi:glycosyltransferase involved in cell wall biosynthesis